MDDNIFGGFTAVAQSISDKVGPIDKPNVANLDNEEEYKDPDTTTNLNADEDADHIPLKDKGDESEEPTPNPEDGDFEEEPVLEPDDKDVDHSLDVELEEAEPEIASFLQEKLFDKFGFDLEDASEFKSIDDVVKFVAEVVEENSKPRYADEELARMDEFVKNGGNLDDYINTIHGSVDPEHIDLDSPDSQKKIIKEHLKVKGYSDAKISKAIERYEDAGTLEEEAYDAKDMLSEYKEKESERLLEEQKLQQERILEEQQKYVESVKNEIEELSDVRGISLTKKEKKELFDYIFKPTKTGRTKYQEDYVKSQKNLIESAYFTMKGDAFVKKVQKKASSDAASRLRKKLASKGNRGRNQDQSGNTVSKDVWSAASRQLRNPFN